MFTMLHSHTDIDILSHETIEHAVYIYIFLILMLRHREVISTRKDTSWVPFVRPGSRPGHHPCTPRQRTECPFITFLGIEDQGINKFCLNRVDNISYPGNHKDMPRHG